MKKIDKNKGKTSECDKKISKKGETYKESIKRISEEDRDLIYALTDM